MPHSLPSRWRLLYAGVAATLLVSLLTVGTFEALTARADTGCPTAAGSYAGGNGAGSPWQIATPAQLQRLRDDSATGWDDSWGADHPGSRRPSGPPPRRCSSTKLWPRPPCCQLILGEDEPTPIHLDCSSQLT